MTNPSIIYTRTDESPALATYSLLPIIEAFTKTANITVESKDISLAGRILARFSDRLTPEQQVKDALAELGALTQDPNANIIKLPNISASVPQLKSAIIELQQKGYALPDYPENPQTDEEKEAHTRYAQILGSAVNPVLREGNSDRRVAEPVKQYAKANPHRMGAWSAESQSKVLSMKQGDFYGSEQSVVLTQDDDVKIQLTDKQGNITVLKASTPVLKGEVIDATCLNAKALCDFYQDAISQAKTADVLLSLHLKATMMKVSDPIMFGHAVKTYYQAVFNRHSALFEQLGVNVNNGLGDLYAKIADLEPTKKAEIEADIQAVYQQNPPLAMVDSDNGITNLHVPSHVIVDASMPAMIRSSGKMWGADGKLKDTYAMIPDRNYAGIYQATIDFCKENGAFDVTTMGSVANVGLMARKAEEYGSHNKTFEIPVAGTVAVINTAGNTLMEHQVEAGDIWRMCQTQEVAIVDWVKLAVKRAKLTQTPAIFWLDSKRAHDRNLIEKVKTYLAEQDTTGLDIQILSPIEATQHALARVKAGQNTISVTGNVLRDYLTDLFPILELGTSAKMLSIVPLLAGGGLFETGAGGSAPKHVEQLVQENHLRWDSLGEYLALAVSLEELAEKTKNTKIATLASTLNTANSQYLSQNRAPSRKTKEIDNRGSSFYIALYWAQALAEQSQESELQQHFEPIAQELNEKQNDILNDLNQAQGVAIDLKGYYQPNPELVEKVMRPSIIFNQILAKI